MSWQNTTNSVSVTPGGPTAPALAPVTPGLSADGKVPKRIEEHLILVMKNQAIDGCVDSARVYAECCNGRTVSVVWHCRAKLEAYNQCLRSHTQPSVLERLKEDYVKTRILPPVKHRAPPPSSH
jgi:COX assembly mitochondrial protein 1